MMHALATTAVPLRLRPTYEPSHPSPNLTFRRPLGLNSSRVQRLRSIYPLHSTNGSSKSITGSNQYDVELELQVRENELDRHGVVNNAAYSTYIQFAHFELLGKFGVDVREILPSNALAVSDLSFKFLAPLKIGDKFVLKVKVLHTSVARIFIQHFIFRLPNHEPIMEAKSTVVWLGKSYQPVRIPSELKNKLVRLGLYR